MPLPIQAALPICQGLLPDEFMGPRAVPVPLTVALASPVIFDLHKELDSGRIENLQGVWIDNSANTYPFTLTMSELGHNLVVPPLFQGVLPVFGKSLSTITAKTTNPSAVVVNLIFLNMPLPFTGWIS